MPKKNDVVAAILGCRGFFPPDLVGNGRTALLQRLHEMGIEVVTLDTETTKLGAVESWEDAQKCAKLFDANRHKIGGVVVSLFNFGDERAVADTLKMANLGVPILIHAQGDILSQMDLKHRRDSWCGKLSVGTNLFQYGIPFSLTQAHTEDVQGDTFKADLDWFLGVCRVVNGLREARIGAIGARTTAFNTVRFSEELLQAYGITVVTLDLSEIFAFAWKLKDDDPRVTSKAEKTKEYINTGNVALVILLKMAKFAVAIETWMQENDLDAAALQCWTSIEENYGIVPCGIMSMMSSRLVPVGCEVDVNGVVAMLALQLASEKPSALVDWNNNYGGDQNKCICFHCSNWPKCYLGESAQMKIQDIIAASVGEENAYGACVGRTPAGPLTFARIQTYNQPGKKATIRCYIGEGEFTDDTLETFGGSAVVHIPKLQKLMALVMKWGMAHHVAFSQSLVADVIQEAWENYLGWKVYRHGKSTRYFIKQ